MTTPGATLQELWREYLLRHPGGYRYTQFTWHYRRWKGASVHSGKLTHRAAEKQFVDFCGKKLHYIDRETGERIDVEVFVAVLPCSQYTFVMAVPSQRREDLIACLSACLEWLGGVPQAIVSDNLKSAVSKGSKYAPVINKTLADFALHYGWVVDPARPYHPQDKSLVERSVTKSPIPRFIYIGYSFMVYSKQIGMSTKTNQFNFHFIRHFDPNNQQIGPDMAFPIVLIITGKFVCFIFSWESGSTLLA